MTELFEMAALGVKAAGVLLLVGGLSLSLGNFLYKALGESDKTAAYRAFRQQLGRTLLLSLEFLVAADIIDTVGVERSLAALQTLGLLVLIRTFLSFSLEAELNGRWPWQGRDDAPASK